MSKHTPGPWKLTQEGTLFSGTNKPELLEALEAILIKMADSIPHIRQQQIGEFTDVYESARVAISKAKVEYK